MFIIENSQYPDFYFIKNVESGNYLKIKEGSKRDGQKIILSQKRTTNNDRQIFSFIPSQNGYYKIKNKLTSKYLDIWNKTFLPGFHLQQWTENNAINQEFYFQQPPNFKLNQSNIYNKNKKKW